MAKGKKKAPKKVEALTHEEASRKNIPTAEYQSVMDQDVQSPIQVAYERRNRDLDPQLVWRGKDESDWSDLVVQAPPLFIQEKIHPKVLIDDLLRRTEAHDRATDEYLDLFADFNGLPGPDAGTEFYQHDANWTNRMILGDSLQVMASLAEREGLRDAVQMAFIDPPYGIQFNSNFQWSTTSRVVRDGNLAHVTREPEQVRAFRDTWSDGIHSYLTYLRDRLSVTRDLLAKSGSVFVQIGDENVHRVRALLDEVFGAENFVSLITFKKSLPLGSTGLPSISDYLLWYAKDKKAAKLRDLYVPKPLGAGTGYTWIEEPSLARRKMTSSERREPSTIDPEFRPFFADNLMSSGYTKTCYFDVELEGRVFPPQKYSWKTNSKGMSRLRRANRLIAPASLPNYVRYFEDFGVQTLHNMWDDTHGASSPVYVVQTSNKVVERCMLMCTDPGDLVLDPTLGSGTTAYVAEKWGRRWIGIDTSRVAVALARARVMGGRFPYYVLRDSRQGLEKEAQLSRSVPVDRPTYGKVRHGFVNRRVPHITLRSIANNAEIDIIWDDFSARLAELLKELNELTGESMEEWEVPHEPRGTWSEEAETAWGAFQSARVGRQREIEASIGAKADFEELFDQPYEDSQRVRVSGPFTVESVSPHRTVGVGPSDELLDQVEHAAGGASSFVTLILENLRRGGVQHAHREDKIDFASLVPWPGQLIVADARYFDGDPESGSQARAGVFVGPEFGTVSRSDLVAAAREAAESGFDVLVACGFNYGAHATELDKMGAIPIIKARMNPDLHMARDLKATGKGNLFVVFGEPDIDVLDTDDGMVQVRVKGVDVFHPSSGEVRSDGPEGIACWFVDTDYNEESFFVRHAYFLGANDPYKSLKTSLKAEIDTEAWETLRSDTSRPFHKPESGRIAVKVINHLGDEVMKVFRVD